MECAEFSSGDISSHLNKFYEKLISDPAFFYKIDLSFIINEHQNIPNIEIFEKQSDSSNGDKCHYDIIGLEDKLTEKFVKKHFKPPNIYVCCNRENIQISEIEFKKLNEFIC